MIYNGIFTGEWLSLSTKNKNTVTREITSTWHRDDPKDRFHFECNECIYAKILGKRGMMNLGAMCCHADIINYGSLPYTDFIRTKTLCQGGDCCDFLFVRHDTEEFERTKSI